MHKLQSLLAGMTLAITAGAVADGGHHHDSPIGGPGNASDVDRALEITMHDNHFTPANVNVTAGETIRFVVENQGELVHEFNIGTAAMHSEHQEEMAAMMREGAIQGSRIHRDRMPQGMQHDHDNSVLLEPGEAGEIIWRFTESTTLEYACNVPGHYQSGMRGDLNVEGSAAQEATHSGHSHDQHAH